MSTWHFITIPEKQSKEIKEIFGKSSRGFGSIPVKVTLNKTTWRTSIFPDSKSGCYFLPLKAGIRKKEEILVDDSLKFDLEI